MLVCTSYMYTVASRTTRNVVVDRMSRYESCAHSVVTIRAILGTKLRVFSFKFLSQVGREEELSSNEMGRESRQSLTVARAY